MCSASSRADALNALTLVENIARLSTQGLFGFVFAALAQVGKPHLTFFANAVSSPVSDPDQFRKAGLAHFYSRSQAIALLAASVLLLSRFPPEGSTILGNHEGEGNLALPEDEEEAQVVRSHGS
jgi:hypothetical protein